MFMDELLEEQEINPNLEALPLLILCDNSGSMKPYVGTLHSALSKMPENLTRMKPSYQTSLDMSICLFDIDVDVLVPFTRLAYIKEIPEIQPTQLQTHLGHAVSTAVKMLAEEKEKLRATDYRQPTLIIMSDGIPYGEKDEAIKQGIADIQEKIRNENWNCICILMSSDPKYSNKKTTVLAEFSSPVDGVHTEFKFNSEDQVSNIIAAINFATATVRAGGKPMHSFMEQAKLLAKLSKNHKKALLDE